MSADERHEFSLDYWIPIAEHLKSEALTDIVSAPDPHGVAAPLRGACVATIMRRAERSQGDLRDRLRHELRLIMGEEGWAEDRGLFAPDEVLKTEDVVERIADGLMSGAAVHLRTDEEEG